MTQTIANSSQQVAPADVAAGWLEPFNKAVAANDTTAILELFTEDAWWRDLVSMQWDLRTLRGPHGIGPFLEEHLGDSGINKFDLWDEVAPAFVDNGDGTGFVQVFLTFRTNVGWGIAVARLVDAGGEWKAYSLMTSLQELDGRELPINEKRAFGERVALQTWASHRAKVMAFEEDPDVIILGAGHAGLAAAAFTQYMGISTLVLERNNSVGDVWRNRYDPLVLHDPIYLDQLPFMPFPETWPMHTPKDKLADWFEIYAKAMDLNIWTNTTMTSAVFDKDAERWVVEIRRPDGSTRTMRPRHFIMATGVATEPRIPAFEGVDDFAGTILHTSEHVSGKAWKGKKAVVVGTGNSGHDIAKDLCDHGASTTMLQRSPTYVMTQKHSQPFLNGPNYTASGPGIEIADLNQIATPFGQMIENAPAITRHMGELDREIIEGLKGAGFLVDDGQISGGLVGLGLGTLGGYLIDVGSAEYIIEGKIKMATGDIRRFVPEGIELADGTVVEADLVILATGFHNMLETTRLVLGEEVAESVGSVWGLDAEGELNSMWRPSGYPNLWFTSGSFPYTRIYSRFLAIQIAADLDGLN